MGGHVRAEGRDSLLLVLHTPACLGRLDVRLLACLTRTLGNSCLSSDHGPNDPFYLVNRAPLLDFTLCSVYPSAKTLALLFVFFACLPCFLPAYLLDGLDSRFSPGVGVDARHRLKQLPRRNSARSRPTCPGGSLPTGASLTWLGVLHDWHWLA